MPVAENFAEVSIVLLGKVIHQEPLARIRSDPDSDLGQYMSELGAHNLAPRKGLVHHLQVDCIFV